MQTRIVALCPTPKKKKKKKKKIKSLSVAQTPDKTSFFCYSYLPQGVDNMYVEIFDEVRLFSLQ